MKWDRYLHILHFLHFTDNKNEPDMTNKNSDRLQKIQNLFEFLNKTFSTFYSPSEHLAIVEVIVLYKGSVISDNTYPSNTNDLASKFATYVTRMVTHMM